LPIFAKLFASSTALPSTAFKPQKRENGSLAET
jgi:hypothetical protein